MKNNIELEEEVLDALAGGHDFRTLGDGDTFRIFQKVCVRCGMVENAVSWEPYFDFPNIDWKGQCREARKLTRLQRKMIAIGPWDTEPRLGSEESAWGKAWEFLRDHYGTH